MIELFKTISNWFTETPLIANLMATFGISWAMVFGLVKSFAKKKVQDIADKGNISKEDLEQLYKELKENKELSIRLINGMKTAYSNSKLNDSVKLRVNDELDGKDIKEVVVEVIKEEPETAQTVVEKLESQLK